MWRNLGTKNVLYVVLTLALAVSVFSVSGRFGGASDRARKSLAAGENGNSMCEFDVSIKQNANDPANFVFVVNASNMTPVRVESILGINRRGEYADSGAFEAVNGPLAWHPTEPFSWTVGNKFEMEPEAVIANIVVWRADTGTVHNGCGVWQKYTNPDPRVGIFVSLDSSPNNPIKLSRVGTLMNKVDYDLPANLFETEYKRVEGVNGYLAKKLAYSYAWGPFNSSNNSYTHNFGEYVDTSVIGILGWKGPDANGNVKLRFGYGASDFQK